MIRIASAKAKGRKLQQLVAKRVSELIGIPWGPDELVRSRGMGQSGIDVPLLGNAKEKFPFSIECKNQENWSMHQWIKQAKGNTKEGTDWLIVAKRNYNEPVVVMDMEVFFKLYERILAQDDRPEEAQPPEEGAGDNTE